MDIEYTIKLPIFTSEGLALYDHIRKHKHIPIELLIVKNNVHLFGLIDVEELLDAGCRHIQSKLVPLYRFHNEIFKSYTQCNSLFIKPESNMLSKNKRISRNTLNIENVSVKLLDDLKALNDEGNQMFLDIRIKLEKPLNDKPFYYEMYKHFEFPHTADYCGRSDESILINELKSELLSIEFHSDDSLKIENLIFSKISALKNRFHGFMDDEKFICCFMSDLINSKNIQSNEENHKIILTELYKSLEMVDKSEDIFLQDIHKNLYSEKAWMNYAIFNAKQEKFNEMSMIVDEVFEKELDSLISSILKAYLLFKAHKYPKSLKLITYLKSVYGEIEELCIMEYVINTLLGVENNLVLSNSKTNEEIEGIYRRTELLWFAARDDGLLSWQNSFIKSAIFFIKIGCYDVAELCLGEYYKTFGNNINYLYLLAAIDSSKGHFEEALNHLNRISENDIVNHNVNVSKIVKLKVCDEVFNSVK